MPEIDTTDIQGIEKLFAGLVFKMLLEEEMISEELVANMHSWKHSGFSVHCGKPIKACDADGRKTLSEYISRAPFSLERMSFNEGSNSVLYRGEHFHPTFARNFDVAAPLEWIARITSHIPKKGAKQVIYYGAYSQAWRGSERRQGISPTVPAEEDSASSVKDSSSCSGRRRQLWVVLLKRVWDIEALKCPKCGGQMKVNSFIEEPFLIRRILKHLDLWEDPRPPPEPLELVCEQFHSRISVPWQDDVPRNRGWVISLIRLQGKHVSSHRIPSAYFSYLSL